ncbi:MAG: AMP-binding protein, partial [Candidatus Competibacteraceae bacterium]|nr:AMP-binding protein [Candidatus Competibacteraceae bacterium]
MAHFDDLETQDPTLREQRLFDALPVQVRHAQRHAPAFAEILARIDPDSVTSREALARLPVTRKSELLELQKARRPLGGFMAGRLGDMVRLYQSPGPLYEPEGRRPDYWRFARALYGAGFRAGELIHNTFSYHFTPAGFMVEGGAAVLGCPVFPAGVGQTEQQVQAIADLKPAGYVGTPSFLKIIVEKAAETGVDISSLTKALASGEALPSSLRSWFAERGIEVYQCYATADLGLIAYESEAREGLIVDEGVLVEIVRPGSAKPVADGEVGEVVVTTFNPDYPLIRFGTGDLSAILPGVSSCGRTNHRIKGWMGRADQTTKVKGMFVHPGQVNEVARRHPQLQRVRLVVEQQDHNDIMTLHCETAQGDKSLQQTIAATLREVTKLRGQVAFVPPGSLPNDGKVI